MTSGQKDILTSVDIIDEIVVYLSRLSWERTAPLHSGVSHTHCPGIRAKQKAQSHKNLIPPRGTYQ